LKPIQINYSQFQ